jgi:hypothetical protein
MCHSEVVKVEDQARSSFVYIALPAVAALLGALIGAFASFGGAYYSSQQDIHKNERDKRAQVYFSYLEAANTYAQVNDRLHEAMAAGQATDDVFQRWRQAAADYRRASNDVSVYGSDDAWNKHLKVAAALPKPRWWEVLPPGPIGGTNRNLFRNAYNDFLAVMCREIPLSPRRGCDRS